MKCFPSSVAEMLYEDPKEHIQFFLF